METIEPPSSQPDVSRWHRRRKIALAVLITGSAASGVVDLLMYDRGLITKAVSLAFMLSLAGVVLLWCIYGSHIRDYTLAAPSRVMIFLIGIVGVPLYFFRSRSRQEWIRSGFGLFLICAVILPYYVAWYLLRFILIQVGYYG